MKASLRHANRGFTYVGNINQHIAEFEQSVTSSNSYTITLPAVKELQPSFTKSLLIMMVRELLNNL